ncbi:MAG: M28 family peptidase [Oscillospiraceae bacterium]|nr:M28 family peptidase [Oscillospiraceae bacterium]
MIQTPMDVLREFPVRKTGRQKSRFLEAVQSYGEYLGYRVKIESGAGNTRNVVFGDPETARFLITAHYDTPAMLWCPNLTMPCNFALNALCQLLNFLVLMIPAFAVGGGVLYLTDKPLYGYFALLASVIGTILLMIFGIPNPRNANDNTSGVIALLEIAASMPKNLRSRVCFVLFDKEQVALRGSAAYRRRHAAATKIQTVVSLNCVGDGDTLMFFPNKSMAENVNLLCLERSCGERFVKIHREGWSSCVSDHVGFDRGVGVMALRRGKLGYWLGRTRTIRDKKLEYTNINILRACLISYIGSHAAE